MADRREHESEDLQDYEVLDANDTLDGAPGEDPLDRGIVTPDRWSAGVQDALKGEDNVESLDDLLAEEEPDLTAEDEENSWDENETDAEVVRLGRDDVPDLRAGRLVDTNEDLDESDEPVDGSPERDLISRDVGIDGGGASAEEAAIHVIDDPADEDDEDDE